MTPDPSHPQRRLTYRNVMESLVASETEQQLRCMAPRLAKLFNQQEVIAFALNRLPALYATSEKGWRQQMIKGRRELASQITTAVQQGLIAVQRDPLRSTPALVNEADEVAMALHQLKPLLQCETLTLKTLPDQIEQALQKARRAAISRNPASPR